MKKLQGNWIKENYLTLLLWLVVLVLTLLYVFQKPSGVDYSDVLKKVEQTIKAENKALYDTIKSRDERIDKSAEAVKKLEDRLKISDKQITELKTKYEKIHIDIGSLNADGTVDKSREYLSD